MLFRCEVYNLIIFLFALNSDYDIILTSMHALESEQGFIPSPTPHCRNFSQ